jgi:Flp pilus assembly protein TadD
MANAEIPDRLFAQAIDLAGMGKLNEAILHYEQAIALRPNFAQAQNNLGNVLQELGRRDEAILHYERALAADADYAEAHMNLGNVLAAVGRYDDAMRHFETALALKPFYADAQMNLGNLLQILNRDEDAIDRYEKALSLKPDSAEAHMNLAIALRALGRNDEATQRYEMARALKPDDAKIKHNKALSCLALGRFTEGWELYEHRWTGVEANLPRPYSRPRWDGERVKGPLLIWGEQGLGDQILFASMIPDLLRRADNIVLEVEPRLVTLMQRSFPRVDVTPMRPELYGGPIAAHLPMGSLGKYFRRSWDAFPKLKRGYLVPDYARAKRLRQRLDRPVVIGISWKSGNRIYGALRTIPLPDFGGLPRSPDYCFVDLQYGDTNSDRARAERHNGIRVEHLDDVDNGNDIDGLAALIAACDLVVTADNTTVHLAGALGKPTWALTPHGPGRVWYWFTRGEDSPWYPRLRVKRQQRGQSWADLIASMAGEISAFVESLRAR